MNERAALLRAICADPDDDTARLVFADWLDENGEPERAAFIRGQIACDLDGFDTGLVKFIPAAEYEQNTAVAQRVELEYHTVTLGARHGATWLAALAGRKPDASLDLGYRFGPFYHGFPFSVFVYGPGSFLDDWEIVFQNAPVTELELGCSVPLWLVAVPGFERMRQLRVTPGCRLVPQDVATLLRLGKEIPHLRVTVSARLPDERFSAIHNVFGNRFRWHTGGV